MYDLFERAVLARANSVTTPFGFHWFKKWPKLHAAADAHTQTIRSIAFHMGDGSEVIMLCAPVWKYFGSEFDLTVRATDEPAAAKFLLLLDALIAAMAGDE